MKKSTKSHPLTCPENSCAPPRVRHEDKGLSRGADGAGGNSLAYRLTYTQMVQHPKWQKRSAEVKAKAGWKCEECGAADKQLDVHHIYYFNEKPLWEYPDCLLICVCRECHQLRRDAEREVFIHVADRLRDLRVAEIKEQPIWHFFEEANAKR